MPDLRNTHKGGWSYVEHELYSVFVPLIGPLGGMVYAAMARLIPRADVDPDYPVTVGSTARESFVKRSTTGEKIREIVALGMVIEKKSWIRNRPSTFTLVPLRDLALAGLEELERRLLVEIGWEEFRKRLFERLDKHELEARFGVHWMDITEENAFPPRVTEIPESAAQPVSSEPLKDAEGSRVDDAETKPSGGCGENGVHPVDTASGSAQNGDFAVQDGNRCPPGGRASTETASVSATEASVSTLGGHRISALRKEEEEEELKTSNTPLPPAKARRVVDARMESRWKGFHLLLKSELLSIPDNVDRAKHFTTIKPDEHDFDACFRAWWLVDMHEAGDVFTVRTGASDRETTALGLEKYATRLERLARRQFSVGRRYKIRFVLVDPQGESEEPSP